MFMEGTVLSHSTDKQAATMTIALKKNGPINALEDRMHHTDTPWYINCSFLCYAWIFGG
jgi:hypothetical protein